MGHAGAHPEAETAMTTILSARAVAKIYRTGAQDVLRCGIDAPAASAHTRMRTARRRNRVRPDGGPWPSG